MKHTPGPWHVGVRQAEKIVYDATGWAIANATVYHGESDAEQVKANARLISAAPDLLAALIGAEKCIAKSLTHLPPDTLGVYCGEWLGEIRETIAKATGEEL